ncbi:hypothetical protein ANMWB30_23850 [Arthrobacter sp. MWB30]|nr:hypothetical protein ANMWB30_23850 [Arthrobacter sp. MWB30]
MGSETGITSGEADAWVVTHNAKSHEPEPTPEGCTCGCGKDRATVIREIMPTESLNEEQASDRLVQANAYRASQKQADARP